MDLSVVYSKTPKGLRARASLIGGLSSHLMKVLAHVDGSAKAETILLKFDHLSPQQLSIDLSKLVQEGYIRLATVTASSDGGWALTTNFTPMIVEEYQSEEELEATTQAKIQAQTRLAAEQQAMLAQEAIRREEDVRLAAELKANKKTQKLHAKEKSKAETKVKAQLAEEQRIAQVAQAAEQAAKKAEQAAKLAEETAQKKAEAEAKLIAEQAKIKAQLEAEHTAKLAEEAQQKAELKAREVAEIAQVKAEQQAKEDAHREIDRIAREAEEAQRKQALENKAKLEAEQQEAMRLAEAETKAAAKAEQARLQAVQDNVEAARKAAEEVEQARLNAEAAAKIEAETKQKEMLELAARTQAKDNARLEIANIVRKAEEDRKLAAAKAKEEKLEAKRKVKAEQEARIKAEKKQKEAAKEQAKAKKHAAEKARLELAQLAQEADQTPKKQVEAEKSAKQQAENKATELFNQEQVNQEQVNQELVNQEQVDHESQEYQAQQAAEFILAKAQAEEQATKAAKENARLEMERIGREAEAVRQKQLVEQHQAEQHKTKQDLAEHKKDLPILDDFDVAEAAAEAAFAAEERITESEKLVRSLEKTTQRAKEDAGRAQIKQTAQAEAAHRQKLQERFQVSIASHFSTKYIKKITATLAKLVLIYIPIVLLLVIGLLHFVNISMLIKPIEQMATETLGVPVIISKVRASIWPQPHLVLEDVVIGTDANQKIDSIHVLPAVSSLFEDEKVVESLVIEGVNIQDNHFNHALAWVNNAGTAKNLKIEQVNLKNLILNIQDLQLEPFDGQLIFTESHALKNINLVSSSNALSVTISPQAGSYNISLKAANWALPFNPKLVFSALDAKAVANQNQLVFSQITGEIVGGDLTAKAIINWPNSATNISQWSTTGNFNLSKADTPLLLTAFSSNVSVDGKLNLSGSFISQSASAKQLVQAANIAANFEISQGSIGDIELARAVIARGSQSLAGDATNFDRLTGSVRINQGQYQYAKLILSSPQFHANGFVNINANEEVSGKINADLAAQSRRLQANFAVAGRGKDLKSK